MPPTIAATAATNATLNTPYSFTVVATGDPTIMFAVSAGALPAGLVLNAVTGVISGTPTIAANYSFTITATSPYGTASANYVLAIDPAAALPATGFDSTGFLAAGVGLVVAGAAMIAAVGRRRQVRVRP